MFEKNHFVSSFIFLKEKIQPKGTLNV